MLRCCPLRFARLRHSWRRAQQQDGPGGSMKTSQFMKAGIGSSIMNPTKQIHKVMAAAQQIQKAREPILDNLHYAEQTAPDQHDRQPKKFELSARANIKRGADVAFEAKSMSDPDWQNVPLSDKHSFVKFISQKLQHAPSEVTEMQRRRFYETTMFDPSREDPHRTVQDAYERVKLGLPTKFVLDRSLGVPDAVYEQADAALFDPQDATKIENAVTEVKQMFTDYVNKKRQGLSTEGERRALAAATEELNCATQKHLSEMFRYAENRLQDTMREERERQLHYVNRVRKAMERNSKTGAARPKKNKKEQIARVLRRNYGLDIETADTVCREMNLQEQFLRECEVLARMTKGHGFSHTAQDQNLDSYTEQIRNIYSMNPEQLCKIDAVQYVAAIEGSAPVDWATNWYAKSVLLPLQSTAEYKALQRIKEEERAALAGTRSQQDTQPSASQEANNTNNENEQGNTACSTSNEIVPSPATSSELIEHRVVDLTSKMFVNPDDARLQTMHEKRLRYIAHIHMESQIKRMRENAVLFEGAEESPECDKVKELYHQLEAIKQENHLDQERVFEVDEARQVFSQIQNLVRAFIDRKKVESKAESKARKIADLAEAIASANEADVEKQVRRIRREKKREQMQRILDLIEKDVRQELHWLETFAEADRPAPLPIPEPMSYVSAGDVLAWRQQELSDRNKDKGNPFKRAPGTIAEASFLGQPWPVPDKPLLFWGTGTRAIEQALKHAAEDAEKRRNGEPLAPPYPCAENPWGWRLKGDPLDEPDYYDEFGNESTYEEVAAYNATIVRTSAEEGGDDEFFAGETSSVPSLEGGFSLFGANAGGEVDEMPEEDPQMQ